MQAPKKGGMSPPDISGFDDPYYIGNERVKEYRQPIAGVYPYQ